MFTLFKIWLKATPLGFLTKIPLKAWLALFCVLAVVGGLLWFRHTVYQDCQKDEQAAQNQAKAEALEKELSELKQYQAFLLQKQAKNQTTINSLKRDLYNAQDKDGDVAPVLRNGLERLRLARERMDE